eukprot:1822629-Pleurochrysis_carterae.AAC.1
MVTGDNLETAIAIAKNCGILRDEDFHYVSKEEGAAGAKAGAAKAGAAVSKVGATLTAVAETATSAGSGDVRADGAPAGRRGARGAWVPKPMRAMEGKDFRLRVHRKLDDGSLKLDENGKPEFVQEEFDRVWPYLR